MNDTSAAPLSVSELREPGAERSGYVHTVSRRCWCRRHRSKKVESPPTWCTTWYHSSPHSVRPVPALSHRQQWANSEPIMSDHCHVPEPAHADRARPRSGWCAKRGERGGSGQDVITGNRANHARSVLSAIQKIDPRSFPAAADSFRSLLSVLILCFLF